jgi:hypothetical protein
MTPTQWLENWSGSYADLVNVGRPVFAMFQQVTGREGSVEDLDFWTDAILSGDATLDDLRDVLIESPLGQLQQRLRDISAPGPWFRYQEAVLSGQAVDDVIRGILASEIRSAQDPRQAALKAASDALNNLTARLFGMDPTGEQEQRYIEALANGEITIEQVAAQLQANENQAVAVGFGNVDDSALRDALAAAEQAQRDEMERLNRLRETQAEFERDAALRAYRIEVKADVDDMYRQLLFREPGPNESDYWVDLIVNGLIDEELVAPRISQSPEAMIVAAYQQQLFRLPTFEERVHWVNQSINGVSIDTIIGYITNSQEAQSYRDVIVPTPGSTEAIVQVMNPVGGGSLDPIMGGSTWNAAYTNQDMIAADAQANPTVELQNYFNPVINISDLEPVSPAGDTTPALAFKARDEIYKAYTSALKREPAESDYQYWEAQLVNRVLSLADFKRYVAESAEAQALAARSKAVTLTDAPPPEVVADVAKKTEGIGAAIGLLSALTFFLGQ